MNNMADTQYILNLNGNILAISPKNDRRIVQVSDSINEGEVTIEARTVKAAAELANEYRAWGAKVTLEDGDKWISVGAK